MAYTLEQYVKGLVAWCGWQAVHNEVMRQSPGTDERDPAVRTTDPDTSHAAAIGFPDPPTPLTPGSKAALMLAEYEKGSWTDQEAAQRVVQHTGVPEFEGFRRRGSQLRARGFIFDTGQRRNNPNSSRQGIVCEITAAGRIELRNIK